MTNKQLELIWGIVADVRPRDRGWRSRWREVCEILQAERRRPRLAKPEELEAEWMLTVRRTYTVED